MIRAFVLLILAISFSGGCSWQNSKAYKLGLVILGPTFSDHVLDSIQENLESVYGIQTAVIAEVPMPKHAFVQMKSPRYRADTLLRYLHRFRNDGFDFVIGITHEDISCSSRDRQGNVKKPESRYRDWGIFGLAGRPGHTAIVSDFRIGNQQSRNYYSRLIKISLHEHGHNLGLPHCPNSHCLMRDAVEKLSTIDEAERDLCNSCREQVN